MNAPRIDKDDLKAAADCIEVARTLGVRFAKQGQGGTWKAIHCPNTAAHANGDRNPSAAVSAHGWKCQGCDEGGDVFSLVATVLELDVRRDFARVLGEVVKLVGGHVTIEPRRRDRSDAHNADHGVKAPTPIPTPPADALAILGAFWGPLASAPLSDRAVQWLEEERGIPATVAHDYGCRSLDNVTIRPTLRALHRGFGADGLTSVGLWNVDKGSLWWPLRESVDAERDGTESTLPGLLVPIWHPDLTVPCPVGWRFRSYSGGRYKSLTDTGARDSRPWADFPLGVRWASSTDPAAWQGTRTTNTPVVIAEGEPDFLTLAWRLEPFVCVLGAPGGTWRTQWDALIADAPMVFDCTHVDADDSTRKVEKRLVDRDDGPTFQPARIRKDRGGDWNDRARAQGAAGIAGLASYVAELVGGAA